MRWRQIRFALFAVAVAATSLFTAPPPARAAAAATETVLFWRPRPDQPGQPTGDTTFFVRVRNADGGNRPAGSVKLTLDSHQLKVNGSDSIPLEKDDPDNAHGTITADFRVALGSDPHYFITDFQPSDTAAFAASDDDLGLATADITASPEPSDASEIVTYTFNLHIPEFGVRHRPKGRVEFTSTDGQHTNPPQPGVAPRPDDDVMINDDGSTTLKASWPVRQKQGRWDTTANYSDDNHIFLPIAASRAHNVSGSSPTTAAAVATTRRTSRKTATTIRRTPGTTAVLAPINPATSSSLPDGSSSSSVTFGDFPTTPGPSSGLAANPLNNNKSDGPPLAVVATTLLALGVLGGIAAFRRFRRGSLDWF
ncbi:MAG: hypothetical protein H0W70_14665 [Actinobacteria bacterium]|nr:hypothetical protein [Actinomycetota bacterium]